MFKISSLRRREGAFCGIFPPSLSENLMNTDVYFRSRGEAYQFIPIDGQTVAELFAR